MTKLSGSRRPFPMGKRALHSRKFVISTGGVMAFRPAEAVKKRLGPATTFYRTVALSFVTPEWLTCLRQVKEGMNMGKQCLPSRPRGPAPKNQPSPEEPE